MIIKSMSRKVPSFGQLIGYIDRDDEAQSYTMRHNLMGRDQDHIRSEFETNGSMLPKRKNGVYLYHEIISITRAEGLSEEAQKARLYDIAQTYVEARCPENMVYGGLHADKDHSYHMHLMISANRAGEDKRFRLSKAQFREIQIQTERYVLEKYPELEQKVAIEKQSERGISNRGAELERRTGKRPIREVVLKRVTQAFEASKDKQSLLDALGRENLELYVRGKTLGVIDHESGKKHRLKTLDLEMADRVAIRMSGEDLDLAADVTEAEEEPKAEAAFEAERQREAETRKRSEPEPERPRRSKGKERDRGPDKAAGEKEKKRRRKDGRHRDERSSDRLREEKQRRQDQREKQAEFEAAARESDKDNYVKYGSNTDLKQDPSQQDMRQDQTRANQAAAQDLDARRQADGSEKEATGNSLLSWGQKAMRKIMQGTEQAMHELEEAGKIMRQGLTGQEEEIGQSKAEKSAEAARQFKEPDPHAQAKADKAQKVDHARQERGRPAPEKDPPEQEQSPQQQAWRDEIRQSRDAGRGDQGRDDGGRE